MVACPAHSHSTGGCLRGSWPAIRQLAAPAVRRPGSRAAVRLLLSCVILVVPTPTSQKPIHPGHRLHSIFQHIQLAIVSSTSISDRLRARARAIARASTIKGGVGARDVPDCENVSPCHHLQADADGMLGEWPEPSPRCTCISTHRPPHPRHR